jgi:hypothetical protein
MRHIRGQQSRLVQRPGQPAPPIAAQVLRSPASVPVRIAPRSRYSPPNTRLSVVLIWTLENVRPQLDGKGMAREEIGYAVREFTDGDEHPVFWGYFPACDWVAFNWLFGHMDELPFHYPQLCLDIKQWAIELGDLELPQQQGARHHALLDARWTRDAWAFLARLDPAAGERCAIGRKNPDQLGARR